MEKSTKNEIDFGNPVCNSNNCQIDTELHVCPVCLRTQEEIDYWDEYSIADKQMILRTIKRRKMILESLDKATDLRWVF